MCRFTDEVHSYQSFVKNNLHLLNNYTFIDEQVKIASGLIDILAYNNVEECLSIFELKNPIADLKAVSQGMKYYVELLNTSVGNYFICKNPEVVIVSPKFIPKFIVPDNIVFKLIQMGYDGNNVIIDYIQPYHKIDILYTKEIVTKPHRTLNISSSQKRLANSIIFNLQNFYKDPLEIIRHEDKIDILYKKIIAKVVFSNKWFDDSVILYIYKNFIKDYGLTTFKYDSAVVKYNIYKTMVKLTVKDVPHFLKEGYNK